MVEDDGKLEPGGVQVQEAENEDEETELLEEVREAMIAVDDEPVLDEVLCGNERPDWMEAIEAELFQIEKLNSWDLVIPPPGANIIPLKYTFHQKWDSKGCITWFKACLVAKGFRQKFGVDYKDTFAPTVQPATL